MIVTGRVLAVDPGEKNIGLAISDPTGMIANPLCIIKHKSRLLDAATIAQLAEENGAGLIVIGQALSSEGGETPQARHAARLAEAVRQQTTLTVLLWDESGSTREARSARLAMGTTRRRRGGHLDEIAATVILQTFLDAQNA